jgi:hypothetical protein
MKSERKHISLNFKHLRAKNLVLIAIFAFYCSIFGSWIWQGVFPLSYGTDYMAFRSIGKIANDLGYSEIYDLENLRAYQTRELITLGVLGEPEDISIFPAPIFPIFILPFQLLSNFGAEPSYWIWAILNLLAVIVYLFYFMRKLPTDKPSGSSGLIIIITLLISYPVFTNLVEGQVQALLLICTGEFIRHAVKNKPIPAGLWLGGLLLKPQLLILIIPVIVILRHWKLLLAFIASASMVLVTSLLMSGVSGLKAMINLWTKFSVGIASNSPDKMINWRMVGVNLNSYLTTSYGWIITGLGIGLTVLVVYLIIKRHPPFGSPAWVMVMLGVFSATLAITWHSHFHMAMILIPFLGYASFMNLLPGKTIFAWVTTTPVAWFMMGIAGLLALVLSGVNIAIYQGLLIAFTGFLMNLVILLATLRYMINHRTTEGLIPPERPTKHGEI